MDPIPTNWLRMSAERCPETVAVRAQDGAGRTYAELLSAAEAGAARLAAETDPGTLCLLEIEPGIAHAVAMHAAMLAGRPFQTLRPGTPAAVRAAALEDAGESAVLDAAWLATGAARSRPPTASPSPEDPASRLMSSGTSGSPRGVWLTYANHFWSAAASAHNLGTEPGDRWLCCLPLDHVAGLAILLRSAIYGTTAVIHDGFDADAVASALAEGEATLVSLVGTQLKRLVESDAPLERARVILVGGGPVPRSALDGALDRGANVVQTYGLTEAASQVCTLAADDADRKRGSVGRPLLNVELGLDNGEIVVAGPMITPEAGALLYTGDLGGFDDDGYLWIEGRKDDLIISGGENISPVAIEEVLRVHPAVADVAVVGRPDEEWGQAVTAVIVVRGTEPGAAELEGHCREVLAAHQVPKRYEFVAELPRTATGKVLRRELR